MDDYLVLRLDAPLMSFGGVRVDHWGRTRDFPGLAMLTGLIGNALGYEHRQARELQRLQDRLFYGVRQDRCGEHLVDFQTVDLGQPFLLEGWTSRGVKESRAGGTAKVGTHIRYREYLADAVYTVALTLKPPGEAPDLEAVRSALEFPARPLFLGRKPCLPSAPLLVGTLRAGSMLDALRRAPTATVAGREPDRLDVTAWWSAVEQTEMPAAHVLSITDERDWVNQIHVGRRRVYSMRIVLEGAEHGTRS